MVHLVSLVLGGNALTGTVASFAVGHEGSKSALRVTDSSFYSKAKAVGSAAQSPFISPKGTVS